jgi:hypothetical protein
MKATLRYLNQVQHVSGYIPTWMSNTTEGTHRLVGTITPTYLVALFLMLVRERRSFSDPLLDRILNRCGEFLHSQMYVDFIDGVRAWRFNPYYCSDWEESAQCASILHCLGFLSRQEQVPMLRLAMNNEQTGQGIGVWMKDDHSRDNAARNVFDPVVSMAVNDWLQRVHSTQAPQTERFIASALKQGATSLYYSPDMVDVLTYAFGRGPRPAIRRPSDNRLFHHAARRQVWYESSATWLAAELLCTN